MKARCFYIARRIGRAITYSFPSWTKLLTTLISQTAFVNWLYRLKLRVPFLRVMQKIRQIYVACNKFLDNRVTNTFLILDTNCYLRWGTCGKINGHVTQFAFPLYN